MIRIVNSSDTHNIPFCKRKQNVSKQIVPPRQPDETPLARHLQHYFCPNRASEREDVMNSQPFIRLDPTAKAVFEHKPRIVLQTDGERPACLHARLHASTVSPKKS